MALSVLSVESVWFGGRHRFVRWSEPSKLLIRRAKCDVEAELAGFLKPSCSHLKGNGGVKGSVRFAHRMASRYRFVARFDVRAYYESIDHQVLLSELENADLSLPLLELVNDYLTLPDTRQSGRGMVAGGAISPLLAAVYLTPLDRAFETLQRSDNIRYERFMDDYVIFAPTRHKLKAAIKTMHATLTTLRVEVHPTKRFIGRTERGFDFLGYRIHPQRRLRPAAQSLNRLVERARRLHEQGATQQRLRQYVQRWYRWLRSGLHGQVSSKGREARIWTYVLKQLQITNYTIKPN